MHTKLETFFWKVAVIGRSEAQTITKRRKNVRWKLIYKLSGLICISKYVFEKKNTITDSYKYICLYICVFEFTRLLCHLLRLENDKTFWPSTRCEFEFPSTLRLPSLVGQSLRASRFCSQHSRLSLYQYQLIIKTHKCWVQ